MKRGDYVYNRYIPQPGGGFQRVCVEAPPVQAQPEQAVQEVPCAPAQPCMEQSSGSRPCSAEQTHRLSLRRLDAGDWLVLAILLLLIVDGDEDDTLSVLLTAAAFILL